MLYRRKTVFREDSVDDKRPYKDDNTLDKVMVKVNKTGGILEMFRCGIW